ncbi:hypothetical protein V7S76_10370 [Aquirufa sp. ROCK2-A2]
MMKKIITLILIVIPICLNAQWKKIDIQEKVSFRGLKKYNNHLWASGTGGTIIHSKDQGKTWEIKKINKAEKLDFRDICLIDSTIILAMSAGSSETGQAKIFRSGNGGKDWEIVFEQNGNGYFFDAIQFDQKSKKGLLVSDPVGGQFQFYSFDLKGENFQPISLNEFPSLLPREAAFAASGSSLHYNNEIATLITGGSQYARIIQSQKGDLQNWKIKSQEVEADSSSGFFSMGEKNRKELVVAGGNYLKMTENKIPLLETNDGGKSWNRIKSQPNFYIEKVIWSKPFWIMTGPSETAIYNPKTNTWKSLGENGYHNIIEINGYLIGVGSKGEIGRLKLP